MDHYSLPCHDQYCKHARNFSSSTPISILCAPSIYYSTYSIIKQIGRLQEVLLGFGFEPSGQKVKLQLMGPRTDRRIGPRTELKSGQES